MSIRSIPLLFLSQSAFSLVLPLDEIDYEYGQYEHLSIFIRKNFILVEETIECHLDSILNEDNQSEIVDRQTSQWIDDIRSVMMSTLRWIEDNFNLL